ncbi:GGDEF domain-containing protein [Loktanella sp. M215]|uniref:GGDEF domain-containing protein n=1 Tax=Loktanella sp. M215 TaxID=2675431 RepID=UPI001F301680|nr:GGDEF domain-containing protein [Loktanella sp. M215]MCF7699242.1 diguanylate cyclase [Loktanella sp. M215]
MGTRRHRTLSGGSDGPQVDGWLRFDPETEAQFEAEAGEARAYHLRYIVWFGLCLYNIYNITGALLTPDIIVTALILRIGVVTTVSLLLAWAVVHLSAFWRERLALLGMINAHLLPSVLFAVTRAEFGAYTFGELTLTLVYGNMLMALRFRHAAVFTAVALAITLSALMLKPGVPLHLEIALAVQIVTAGIFSLSANYLMERRRCLDYVTALTATHRAERAEVSHRHLTEMSQTDALTGLPNRRYLDDRLAVWCAGPNRVATLMIDVDHFKLYNDSLGHPAGDDCLRQLAQVFRDALPDSGAFCARFGGEEFVIALQDAAAGVAQQLARRIVTDVRALAIAHPGRGDSTAIVTVSVGLAAAAAHEPANPGTLIAQSDASLYAAKRAGRNRIETYRPPVPRAAGFA